MSTIALLLATAFGSFASADPVGYERVVALNIGIEEFANVGAPARFAEKDAAQMAEVLKRTYDFETETLLGKQATKAAIMRRLDALTGELTEKDALVVFFATHGEILRGEDYRRNGFLIAHDSNVRLAPGAGRTYKRAEIEEWNRQAISMSQLVTKLNQSKAGHVLLLVDACYSGALVSRGLVGGALPQLITRKSRMVMSATAHDQKAYPDERTGHGFFTAALLKQLKRRSAATLTEVFFKTRDEVAEKSGNHMLPMMATVGGDGGEFVFLPKTVNPDDLALVLKEAQGRGRGLLAEQVQIGDVALASLAQNYRFADNQTALEKKWQAQFKRFRDLATFGDPMAMAALHYCYAKGLGVEKSEEDAYLWAQRALETGAPIGEHAMARCLWLGVGVEKNLAAAEKLYKSAVSRGLNFSRLALAEMRRDGRNRSKLPDEDAKAIEDLLEPAVKDGLAASQRELARMLFSDYGFREADDARCLSLMRQAVEGGDEYAKLLLAEIQVIKPPPIRDIRRAGELLKEAAQAGVADAQYVAAQELLLPDGKSRFKWSRDLRAAKRYADLAARQDHARAMVLLAEFYEKGLGVDVNFNLARKWCEKAAEANSADAFVKQCMWYFNGTVYPQDNRKAFSSAQKAAQLNNALGCQMLAAMYEDGIGFGQQNKNPRIFLPTALYWYMKAYRIGTLEFSKKRLLDFRGDVNIEKAGIPLGEFPGANMLLARFEKEHPAEAADFIKEFLPNLRKPMPKPKPAAPTVAVKTKAALVALGEHSAADGKQASRGAREQAIVSLLKTALLKPGADDKTLQRATEVALTAFDDEDVKETLSLEGETFTALVCLTGDSKTLRAALKKEGIPLRAGGGGLFVEELSTVKTGQLSAAAVNRILDAMRSQSVSCERGDPPRAKRNGDKYTTTLNARLQVDLTRYRELAKLAEFALRNSAVRMIHYTLEFTVASDGDINYTWPHQPARLGDARVLDFHAYRPEEVRKWPRLEGVQSELFLVRDLQLDDNRKKGVMHLAYVVMPFEIKLPRLDRKLKAGLHDGQGKIIASENASISDAAIVGKFKSAYQPGQPLGGAYTWMAAPLFGSNTFFLELSGKQAVRVTMTEKEASEAADWFVEIEK